MGSIDLQSLQPQQEEDISLQVSNLPLETFKTNKADILAAVQQRVVAKMTSDKMEESTFKQLVEAMALLSDKERLERGQSTSNSQIFARLVDDTADQRIR